ncbi:MAG: DoxX family protein [Flavobacteriales bacterium]|nr:DoxX family protein [Flavobacteriales bacterium]
MLENKKLLAENIIEKIKFISMYTLSIMYFTVGVKHFTEPDFFKAIVPNYLPFKEMIVYVSGAAEIILSVVILFKKYRKLCSTLLIILLISIFPANIFLFSNIQAQEFLGITKQQALIRLPFQIPLILLAHWHGKSSTIIHYSIFCILIFIPTIIYFLSI